MNFEGWKFWREKPEENPPIKERSEGKLGRSAHTPQFTVENIGMVEYGMFSSCFSLCSCFPREGRSSTPGTGVPKDVSSRVDSISSSEVNSSSERIPPSPARVVRATQNFAPSMRIGKGAFGVVYKGYLEDGQVIAIKRAKGDHFMDSKNKFSKEVELLSKINHQNLVKLLGFLDKGGVSYYHRVRAQWYSKVTFGWKP
ncbi:hypothetical protein SAY87_005586 [Trapa incisa]|uniref:Protein kinase domain-containing protein n=1 Tax=Trapa incisa TaxID=236973 RepID=A0AAN7K342_9MYRT|nr:hypothetical protein SAY87_005586 [Trapa incisa]